MNNLFEELDLSKNSLLKALDIADNNFPKQDLSFLSHLIDLRMLAIGNSDKRKKKDNHNRFVVSWDDLKNMEKLELISFSNLEIRNVRDLPKEIKVIDFPSNARMKLNSYAGSIPVANIVISFFDGGGEKNFNTLIWGATNAVTLSKTARHLKYEYDFLIEDIKEKAKARNLLQEEFQEKDEQIKQLEQGYRLLQEKSTNLQEQVGSLIKEIENKIQEIIDLRKQKTETEEKLDKNSKINSSHENLISNLKQNLTEKNNKLKQAEEDLKSLKDRAEKLLEKCQYYLELISNYYQKQKELEYLKKNSVGKPLSNEELDEILGVKGIASKLEERIENIIKEQSLYKKDFLKNIRREGYDLVTSELGAENNKFIDIETFKNLLINNKEKLEISINNINNIQIGDINFDNVQIGGILTIGVGQIGDGVDFNLNQNKNWTNFHSNFTLPLINQWKTNNFTYSQTQEWINIGLAPNDSDFCAWLRDTKHLTAEECLNYHDLNQLKSEYQAQLLQAQIQISPKN